MAQANLGELVAKVWGEIGTKPYESAIIEMKTGKRYFVAAKYFGKTIEMIAEYRTRYQTGHFDLECVYIIEGVKVPFYRQRYKRSEPRFDVPPSGWPNSPVPIEIWPAMTLPKWKPDGDPFTSDLYKMLR